nr:hypothetical protein [Actinomadura sp. CNU-125]
MTEWTVDRAAVALRRAEDLRADRGPITAEWPELDLDTAYRVQDEVLRRKVAEGRRVVGVKLGLTSAPKQERMGIDSPLTAWLTDDMPLPPGAPLHMDGLIHPRVEPEIVFIMGERLAGPDVTAASALAAVARVAPDSKSSTAATPTSSSRSPTSSRTTPRPPATSSATAGATPPTSTWPPNPAAWRSTARRSTPPPARPSRATPPRPSRSPPTPSRAAASRSNPAGSSSPAASPTPSSPPPAARSPPPSPASAP